MGHGGCVRIMMLGCYTDGCGGWLFVIIKDVYVSEGSPLEVDLAKEVVNHVTAEFEAARPHPAHHKPFRWNTNTAR